MVSEEQTRKTRIFSPSFYNPISIFGAAVAAVSLATTIFLTFVEFLQKESPPYIGIVGYVIVPAFLIFCIVLFFVGAWRERRRRRRGKPASRLSFTFDLNVPRQRIMVTAITTLTVIFLLFTAYGSYRTFEWTESVEFCGATCHEVMEPEYTAYQNSPHARVKMRGLPCRCRSGMVRTVETVGSLPGVRYDGECVSEADSNSN
jgi:amino acid transporter